MRAIFCLVVLGYLVTSHASFAQVNDPYLDQEAIARSVDDYFKSQNATQPVGQNQDYSIVAPDTFSITASDIALSFIVTWVIGLAPAFIARYIICRAPLPRKRANWVAAISCVFFAFLFLVLKASLGDPQPRLSPVWIVIFLVSRWIMVRKGSGNLEIADKAANHTGTGGHSVDVLAMLSKFVEGYKQNPILTAKAKSWLFSTTGKLLIFYLLWVIFVMLRTAESIEIFGMDFSRWDDDAFWLNILTPICVYSLTKYFLSSKKAS